MEFGFRLVGLEVVVLDTHTRIMFQSMKGLMIYCGLSDWT